MTNVRFFLGNPKKQANRFQNTAELSLIFHARLIYIDRVKIAGRHLKNQTYRYFPMNSYIMHVWKIVFIYKYMET
jgi:hypothetical protein